MEMVIDKFKSIYTMQLMLLVIGIGLFLVFVDMRQLKEKHMPREARVAKVLGKFYIFLGIVLYILTKII